MIRQRAGTDPFEIPGLPRQAGAEIAKGMEFSAPLAPLGRLIAGK